MTNKIPQSDRRRIVVTGFGAITPLGDAHETWQALLAGQSGIRRVTRVNLDHVPVQIGGQVQEIDTSPYFSRKDARRMPLVSQFAVIAAKRALHHAQLSEDKLTQLNNRAATVMGTTMGPHLLAESMTSAYRANGHQRPNPVSFGNCLPNIPAHYVSRMLSIHGPLHTPIAACATGTQSLGLATDLIRTNQADVVVAGATEAILQDYIYAGFASMRALAEGYEDNPTVASRPFDLDRTGFVLSEGSGVLILEELEHATQRGSTIYAEIAGHANTSDAYHIAMLEPGAKGMVSAVQGAINDARITPSQINYINAHGSGTLENDRLESLAYHKVFGNHAHKLAISSNKSVFGHLMAAAGAVEAIMTILTMDNQYLPPTINLATPDPNCDLDYVPNQARSTNEPIRYAMSNNFGLGGQNASVIFREPRF